MTKKEFTTTLFFKLRDASSTKPAVVRRPRTEIFEQSCLLCQWQEGNLFDAYNHRHDNGSDNDNDDPRSCWNLCLCQWQKGNLFDAVDEQ